MFVRLITTEKLVCFECQVMLSKILKESDVNVSESRVYLPRKLADKFGFTRPGIFEVIVYDDQMNPWRMNFFGRNDNRSYLGSEWHQFVIAKGLREGDTVTFSKLIWRHAGTMPRLFKITHEAARRGPVLVPFDLNKLPPQEFDLNELPPPEN
ncbi:hypothetical protein FH972_018810 [Carpinus fangiana]|uniref:TF-B3 domain-containing protein n=1 Tax=Carpinus fangiana TaxID=176857 RepID=A0A5N6RRA7_9ROSI|nr:hypothetical protein FH972_018810 [Carpinus fangiana]